MGYLDFLLCKEINPFVRRNKNEKSPLFLFRLYTRKRNKKNGGYLITDINNFKMQTVYRVAY